MTSFFFVKCRLKFHDFLVIPRFLHIVYSRLVINHKFQSPGCLMDTVPFFNWIPHQNYCNTSFPRSRGTSILIMCTVLFRVLYFIRIFSPVTKQVIVVISMCVYILHINEGYVRASTFIGSSRFFLLYVFWLWNYTPRGMNLRVFICVLIVCDGATLYTPIPRLPHLPCLPRLPCHPASLIGCLADWLASLISGW